MQKDDILCDMCVYSIENLEWGGYVSQGMAEVKDAGCSLDFTPGDDGCNEMRTSNCGMRKLR